ncbi:hypothetical protein HZB04_00360 [Candidatus Wolfebacteria bacterium]|nr:hypothetical protein [Candidatus Wolfebacteria bacterium]
MGNKNCFKNILKDLPYSFGAASLAVILGVGQGIINIVGGIPVSKKTGRKMGIVGSMDWVLANSRDFVSDYIEIKKALKDLTGNNARIILCRLQKKGLVEKNNNNQYELTLLGKKYFNKIKNIETKKWDGKWRMVFFDIPEKLKKERDWLRTQLCGFEYQPIQKSVFLGKFPLTKDFFQDILNKKLNNFIKIMTIGEIDDEKIFESFN